VGLFSVPASIPQFCRIFDPKLVYPQFPYVIFDVILHVFFFVLFPPAPYLALLAHYRLHADEGRWPAPEHIAAVETGCMTSLMCTAGLAICMFVVMLREGDGYLQEIAPAFAVIAVLVVVPMAVLAAIGWGIAKVWAEEQKIRKSEKEQGYDDTPKRSGRDV